MSREGGQVYFGLAPTPDPTSHRAEAPQLRVISPVPPCPHCLLHTNPNSQHTEAFGLHTSAAS